jgi:two-component system, LytTR family, response regulator
MKIVIIEDEPLVARDLQMLIGRLEPEAQILEVISSVESARKWFAHHPEPDLILSDIQLSDGISFEIFESVKTSCPIIFTTAYDDYAIRAFKVNSIDYLLKPIDSDELAKAIRKYKQLNDRPATDMQMRNLIREWSKGSVGFKERFLVLHGNSMVPVLENDVAFFHKDQLIFLFTLHNEKYICEMNALDDLESLLNPQKFFRVNRQYIIHVQSVAKVRTTHKGLAVVLKPPFNLEIDISREKATAFKKWLD